MRREILGGVLRKSSFYFKYNIQLNHIINNIIDSTLNVENVEKKLHRPPPKHIPIWIGSPKITVEPCTWCTPKLLEPF